jgi:hypothetical protein
MINKLTWVSLLGVDEVRELGRVSQKEDSRVVEDHIPVLHKSASHHNCMTNSLTPSSVRILTENPLGSLAISCDPDSPPTVENLILTEHLFPFSDRISARHKSSSGSVHSK